MVKETISFRRMWTEFDFVPPDIVKENENDVDMSSVFQRLSEDNIPGLLPGGGLFAKRSFVEETFNSLCPDKKEATVRS